MQQQQEFHSLLKEMMYKVAQRRANSTALAHVMLSFIVAPLFTLSTSLQVSLPQNRKTILDLTELAEGRKAGVVGDIETSTGRSQNKF